MRTRLIAAALTLLALGALASVIAASPMAERAISRFVVAGGGGRSSSSSYIVQGTAGQPAAGLMSSGGRRLASGFWVGRPAGVPPATATGEPGTPGTPGLPTPTGTAPPTGTAEPTRTPGPTGTPGATSTLEPPEPEWSIHLAWVGRDAQ